MAPLRVPSRDFVSPPRELHFGAEILKADDRMGYQREYRQEAATAAALGLLVVLQRRRRRRCRNGGSCRSRRCCNGGRRCRRRIRIRRRQRIARDVDVLGVPLVASRRVGLLIFREAASSLLLLFRRGAPHGTVHLGDATEVAVDLALLRTLQRRFTIYFRSRHLSSSSNSSSGSSSSRRRCQLRRRRRTNHVGGSGCLRR